MMFNFQYSQDTFLSEMVFIFPGVAKNVARVVFLCVSVCLCVHGRRYRHINEEFIEFMC